MPNVNDIVTIAEALEKSPVRVEGDRCVAVRNRNANCRACVAACPFDAIEVVANELTLDGKACVGCGACVVACPTEALVAVSPAETVIARALDESTQAAGGHAVIACARIASKHQADPARFVEVPCVARIDETLLLEAVAHGANEVTIVDGTCATCKYRACVAGVDDIVDRTNDMLECQGNAMRVKRASEFPDQLLLEDVSGKFGATRRGFFSQATKAAKETAVVAAKTTIEQELGVSSTKAEIGERLRVTAGGTLPLIEVARHMRLLDAFDAVGQPGEGRLDSPRFATVTIDAIRCNECGMCAMFCPTGALRRDVAKKPGEKLKYLEFTACDCVNCGLCRDVCWKGAVSCEPGVDMDQLYDFEPATLYRA